MFTEAKTANYPEDTRYAKKTSNLFTQSIGLVIKGRRKNKQAFFDEMNKDCKQCKFNTECVNIGQFRPGDCLQFEMDVKELDEVIE